MLKILWPPTRDIARLPGELVCLEAVAPPDATVTATVGSTSLALMPQGNAVELPPNYAVLTAQTDPPGGERSGSLRELFFCPEQPGSLGQPTYTLTLGDEQVTAQATGLIEILDPEQF